MEWRRIITLIIGLALLVILSGEVRAQHTAPSPGKVELRSAEVTLPMQYFGNRPVVELMINGKGPFKFILDTGAEGGLVSQDLAEELKLPVKGEMNIGSPVGTHKVAAKIVQIDRMEVGGILISDFQSASIDQSKFFNTPDAPRGVLSPRVFTGMLVTIDYPQNLILIRHGELPAADNIEIFEYDPARHLPTVRISVAGIDFEVHVDSGSSAGITLSEKYSEQLPLASKPIQVGKARTIDSEFIITRAKLDGKVKLGRYTIENPEITFGGPIPIGNLGSTFLNQFAITLDRKNNRIRFEQKK